MEKHYTLTSSTFEGVLTFTYNSEGTLVSFQNEAKLPTEHLQFLHANFPVVESLLERLAGKSKTLQIRLVTTAPVTFSQFFDAYNYKVERREAERAWEKMTPEDRKLAYESIPAYNYFLMTRTNQNRLYPVSFLRGRKFENDYKALAKGQ